MKIPKLRFRPRRWSRPELFSYGQALHTLIESLIEHPKKFKSKKQLARFLKSKGITLPDFLLRALWWKFWNIRLDKFHDWIHAYIDSGYVYTSERYYALPVKRRNKIKLKFYRPDIILVNHKKKHVVLVEIKSGARSNSSQLHNYKNLLRTHYKNWKISMFVYLAGPDKIKKVK